MSWIQILVTLIGVSLIASVGIFFFGASTSGVNAFVEGERQRVRITVKRGYAPSLVTLQRGVPAVLEFFRDEDDPCSERVVLDGFNQNVFLPPFTATEVELLPDREGSFTFACGMGMLRGRILVSEPRIES